MGMTIGIDEAGRGPLAGPLAVCGVCLFAEVSLFDGTGIRDSKKMSEKRRQEAFAQIQEEAKVGNLKYVVSFVSPHSIDNNGMALSLKSAVNSILSKIGASDGDTVLLDGSLYAPKRFKNQKTIIKGDESEVAIALASIVAKVSRDQKMLEIAQKFPGYRFDKNKGYGTKTHSEAILRLGLSPVHRRSFCRNLMNDSGE